MRHLLLCSFITLLAACGDGTNGMYVPDYPMAVDDARRVDRGRVGNRTHDEKYNLLNLGSGTHANNQNRGWFGSSNNGLWNAALDTLSFMPFEEVDAASGILVTDWYENPEKPGERFKVNARVTDQVKLNVFRQLRKSGSWRDASVDSSIASQLAATIRDAAGQ